MTKRIIGILLAAGTVFFSAAVSAAAADIKYVRGDANGDGIVNVDDVTDIQRKLAKYSVSSFKSYAADVDNNGVGVSDASNIQRYLAGYDDSYQIGKTFLYDEYELPFVPSK